MPLHRRKRRTASHRDSLCGGPFVCKRRPGASPTIEQSKTHHLPPPFHVRLHQMVRGNVYDNYAQPDVMC